MKKTLLFLSTISVVLLSLFSLTFNKAEASDLNSEDLDSETKTEILNQYEKLFGPVKRAATEQELSVINKAIEEKIKNDENFEIEGVLEELGLEDVGFQEADNTNLLSEPKSEQYEYEDGVIGDNFARALNIGTIGFRNMSHTSTNLFAALQITNIGFTKLDSFNGLVTPYTKTTSGAWVQNGPIDYIAQSNVIVGTTILGYYTAKHSNRGARLTAAGYVLDKGKITTVSPASVTYNVK